MAVILNTAKKTKINLFMPVRKKLPSNWCVFASWF